MEEATRSQSSALAVPLDGAEPPVVAVVLEPGRPRWTPSCSGRPPVWRKRSAVVSSPSDRSPPMISNAAMGPRSTRAKRGRRGRGSWSPGPRDGSTRGRRRRRTRRRAGGGGRLGRLGGLGGGPPAMGGAGTEHDVRARGGRHGPPRPSVRDLWETPSPSTSSTADLVAAKPAFSGALVADITCASAVQMVTVRPGVLAVPSPAATPPPSCTARRWQAGTGSPSVSRRRDDDIEVLARADVVIGVGTGVAARGVREPQPTGRGHWEPSWPPRER